MKINCILMFVAIMSLISIGGITATAITDSTSTIANIAIDRGYIQTNLVSDIPGAAQITDPNLVNSWGLERSQVGQWFIADNGMGMVTTYKVNKGNGKIKILPLKITIPAVDGNSISSPTGIVFNVGNDFNIGNIAIQNGNIAINNMNIGNVANNICQENIGNIAIDTNPMGNIAIDTNPMGNIAINTNPMGNVAENIFPNIGNVAPARYIVVTEDGTISGWNKNVNSNTAIQEIDNFPDAVYKGVTIANDGCQNLLYVTDFRGGKVDVFNTHFGNVNMAVNSFQDSNIPDGFAPFNVQNIGGKIYVSYAKQDDAKHDNLDGPGLGYVDVFNPDGSLDKRLEHGPWMNAPWGMTIAPSNFGRVSKDILIGNFGSGNIAAFDPATGKFKGLLADSKGPITIDGLWGIKFGNGKLAGPINTLFFTAGIDGEMHGLFGTITIHHRSSHIDKDKDKDRDRDRD
jgi:uncharacterized protein (TIGR03118 family)